MKTFHWRINKDGHFFRSFTVRGKEKTIYIGQAKNKDGEVSFELTRRNAEFIEENFSQLLSRKKKGQVYMASFQTMGEIHKFHFMVK